MKRSREFLLWSFFLAVCFWAGYLKGFLPLSFKQNLFIKGPVRILNASPFNLPGAFLKSLEEELGQKIEVQRVKDWNELQAKLVTKTGPHLVLAPTFWAEDLDREFLLMRLNPIQSKIENRIAADFISLQGKNLTTLPLYWTVTEFRTHEASLLGENLEQALQNKALTELYLYPDQDLIGEHLKGWSLKIKDIGLFQFNKIPSEISKTAVWEVPHLVDLPGTRILPSTKSKALLIYGLMIPRNSLNKKLSYRLVERLMDADIEEPVFAQLPLGSTLQNVDGAFKITKEQRSSQLRDLKLHELMILEKRRPDVFQESWQKYNIIAPN